MSLINAIKILIINYVQYLFFFVFVVGKKSLVKVIDMRMWSSDVHLRMLSKNDACPI